MQPATRTATRPAPVALAAPVALSAFVDMLVAHPGTVRTWLISDVWCLDAIADDDGIRSMFRRRTERATSADVLATLWQSMTAYEFRTSTIHTANAINAPYMATNATRSTATAAFKDAYR